MKVKIKYASDHFDKRVRFEEINTLEDLLKLYEREKRSLMIDTFLVKTNKKELDADFRILIVDDFLD